MGKASGRRAKMRATRYVVRVEFCDGSGQMDGFATREQAMRMVDVVRPMVDSVDPNDEGVELVELIEKASGAVEFRQVRSLPLGVRVALASLGGSGEVRYG